MKSFRVHGKSSIAINFEVLGPDSPEGARTRAGNSQICREKGLPFDSMSGFLLQVKVFRGRLFGN